MSRSQTRPESPGDPNQEPPDPYAVFKEEFAPFRKVLVYTPLTLVNLDPENSEKVTPSEGEEGIPYEMREHLGPPSEEWDDTSVDLNDKPIDPDSLLGYGIYRAAKPLLLICITAFNEHPRQVVESLAGVYRAYYELSKWRG